MCKTLLVAHLSLTSLLLVQLVRKPGRTGAELSGRQGTNDYICIWFVILTRAFPVRKNGTYVLRYIIKALYSLADEGCALNLQVA